MAFVAALSVGVKAIRFLDRWFNACSALLLRLVMPWERGSREALLIVRNIQELRSTIPIIWGMRLTSEKPRVLAFASRGNVPSWCVGARVFWIYHTEYMALKSQLSLSLFIIFLAFWCFDPLTLCLQSLLLNISLIGSLS